MLSGMLRDIELFRGCNNQRYSGWVGEFVAKVEHLLGDYR